MLVVVTFVQQGYYLLKLLQSPEVDLYFFRFDIADHAGRILDCITDEDGNARAVIGFPDGRQVQYEADQMEMIEHANATTIHKAQGSECPVVIIPWVKAFYMMLKRNILYTGVTRAKSKVYLVGEWAAVCQAIHTDDSGTRNTILSERIVQYYDQYQSEQKPEMEQLKLVV